MVVETLTEGVCSWRFDQLDDPELNIQVDNFFSDVDEEENGYLFSGHAPTMKVSAMRCCVECLMILLLLLLCIENRINNLKIL